MRPGRSLILAALAASLAACTDALAPRSDAGVPVVSCLPTEADMEGPFFLEDAPFREHIAPDNAGGDVLTLTGTVYLAGAQGCVPLNGAVIDVWQAGVNGEYSTADTFDYRGRIETDEAGSYRFQTIVPPPYAGRPSHIHLKVSHPDATPLTTQLYIEGDPALGGITADDSPRVLRLAEGDGAFSGEFTIVLTRR